MPRQDDTISESDHGKIPKSTFEIYRSEGDSQFRNKSYAKAIDCYTQALEIKPEDQYCLVNRSKCYLNSGNIEKALQDAEKCLENDKAYHKGIHQKAEVLYFKGDFENALVYYHRGFKLRPEMQEFRLGIQKTEEAINNSVGDAEIIKLKSDGDLSYFYQAEEKKKPVQRSSYQKPKKEDTGPKRAQRNKPPADEKTIKKMLGNLYTDREYLEKLLREESAKARRTEHSDKIQDLCVEGLNYLDSRSEFWQQQKPLYSTKKPGQSRTSKSCKTGEETRSVKYVLTNMEEIDEKQMKGEHDGVIKQSNQLLKTIENWSVDDLPNKFEVQANLHSYIGNSWLDLDKFENALKHHEKDLAIGQEHSVDEAQSRALDNIGRVYAKKGQHAKAIEVWERKTPKTPLEATWLYHEIGRCYLELNNASKGKEYGEKSLEAAKSTDDQNWQLNANVLLAQSEVKLGLFQHAIDNFGNARDFAKMLDNHQAEDAINRAIDDVSQKIIEEEKMRQEEASDNEQQQEALEQGDDSNRSPKSDEREHKTDEDTARDDSNNDQTANDSTEKPEENQETS